jgi:DNA invertase Pin-like site-specific DNA recombinase
MLHVYAALDEKERELISQRTKEALQAAKRRAVKLGKHGLKLAKEAKASANAHAEELLPVIRELRAEGITSVRAIAAALNERGVPSAKGGEWHPTAVARLLSRLG